MTTSNLKRALSTTAIAVLGLSGYAGQGWLAWQHAATTHRACSSPVMPSGTVIEVDTHGNGWTIGSDVRGPVRVLTCTRGQWTKEA